MRKISDLAALKWKSEREGWRERARNLTKHCSLEEQSLIYCNEFAGVKRYARLPWPFVVPRPLN